MISGLKVRNVKAWAKRATRAQAQAPNPHNAQGQKGRTLSKNNYSTPLSAQPFEQRFNMRADPPQLFLVRRGKLLERAVPQLGQGKINLPAVRRVLLSRHKSF